MVAGRNVDAGTSNLILAAVTFRLLKSNGNGTEFQANVMKILTSVWLKERGS